MVGTDDCRGASTYGRSTRNDRGESDVNDQHDYRSAALSQGGGTYVYGIGDKQILSTLCPGGKERMRKLMEMVRRGRLDLSPLITHSFHLSEIEAAYELFGNQRDHVVKVAIRP